MKRLTKKEEEVMKWFWSKGPLFVKDMQEFYPDPKPHPNTLSTIVRGLEAEGFVSHKAYGNSHQYFAVVDERTYHRSSLRGVIKKYFGGSALSAISALVEEEEITIEELKQLIDKA